MVRERSDGGEERLIDARAGGEIGVRGYLRPWALYSLRQDLSVVRVLADGAPGEGLRDADEGM